MKYLSTLILICLTFPAMSDEPVIIPPEIVAQCKAGGGCVIVLESDLKAARLKAKAEGEKTCRKTI